MRVTLSASRETSSGLFPQVEVDRLRQKIYNKLPCNCGHIAQDHEVHLEEELGQSYLILRHCFGYSVGKCSCDKFAEMENLQYVEWLADQRKHGHSSI